jgi:hypothetical protein
MKTQKEALKRFFYQDGSLRDILLIDTNYSDWKLLLTYFRQNFWDFALFIDGEITFKDFNIEEIFEIKKDSNVYLNLKFHGITISGYFYKSREIVFDISPKEVESEETVLCVIDFMKQVARITNKIAILTPETTREMIYITVKPNGDTFMNL